MVVSVWWIGDLSGLRLGLTLSLAWCQLGQIQRPPPLHMEMDGWMDAHLQDRIIGTDQSRYHMSWVILAKMFVSYNTGP